MDDSFFSSRFAMHLFHHSMSNSSKSLGSYWVLFAICFILILFHYMFCFIASTRNEKNLICRELRHMLRTNLEVLYARSFLLQSHNGKYVISSNCRVQIWKSPSYMHDHFCFCHITGNIVVSSNCRARFYESYMQGHFHFWHLIAMHKLTDLYMTASNNRILRPRSQKVIIIRSIT